MFRPACIIAALLVAVGLLGFFLGHPDPATGHASLTALIPEWIGVALGLLALVAHTYPATRRHAMHAAALISLIAVLGTAVQLCKTLANTPALADSPEQENAVAHLKIFSMSATLLLCLVFLVLCVRSFIAIRRARAV
jgi:uncharacterized BrkB/YihY/UPF0761 family membrane protein